MDIERERGRIAGLAVRREKKLRRLERMLPVVALAREEIEGQSHTNATFEEIAAWLNRRGYTNTRGKPWSKQSFWNFCQIEGSQIDAANQEFEMESGILEYQLNVCAIDQKTFKEHRARILSDRNRKIAAAKELGMTIRAE